MPNVFQEHNPLSSMVVVIAEVVAVVVVGMVRGVWWLGGLWGSGGGVHGIISGGLVTWCIRARGRQTAGLVDLTFAGLSAQIIGLLLIGSDDQVEEGVAFHGTSIDGDGRLGND